MSYFASSASTDVALWHDKQPSHLVQSVEEGIAAGFQATLDGAREVVVEAEYSLAKLAEELGIEHFAHNVSCDLTGCRLVLQPHGHLEIHRDWARHPTTFPVAFKDREIVEV